MRGLAYVGRIRALHAWHETLCIELESHLTRGDVLFVSPYRHGPMRTGSVQILDVEDDVVTARDCPRLEIPQIAEGDYAFRATAIGERIFGRAKA